MTARHMWQVGRAALVPMAPMIRLAQRRHRLSALVTEARLLINL